MFMIPLALVTVFVAFVRPEYVSDAFVILALGGCWLGVAKMLDAHLAAFFPDER